MNLMGSGTNLVTTVIGFGLSATFIVFVCTRIICGRLRGHVGSRTIYEFESRADIERVNFTCDLTSPSSSSYELTFLLVNIHD